jgi:hypothetical protein
MQCQECERLQDLELRTLLDYVRQEAATRAEKQRNKLKELERKHREAERAFARHQRHVHAAERKAA